MGVPGWMTDPEHDDEPPPRPPITLDSWLGADFGQLVPDEGEQALREEQLVDAARRPLRSGQTLGIVGILGGSAVVVIAVALLAHGIPEDLRIALCASALIGPALFVWLRLSPRSYARLLNWFEHPLIRPRR